MLVSFALPVTECDFLLPPRVGTSLGRRTMSTIEPFTAAASPAFRAVMMLDRLALGQQVQYR